MSTIKTYIPQEFTEELRDHFGKKIAVGDLVLIANAVRFGDTQYKFMLITSRTKAMIRAITIGDSRAMAAGNVGSTIGKVEDYARQSCNKARRAGAVLPPWNVVLVQKSLVTQTEITVAINAGITQKSLRDEDDDDSDIWAASSGIYQTPPAQPHQVLRQRLFSSSNP